MKPSNGKLDPKDYEIKEDWYVGRWKITFGDPSDCFDTEMDVELVENGFVIGMTSELKYRAIPVTSIICMEKE